jgi:PAS domain S-box-containing protein
VIAKGDLSERVDIRSDDEIGLLARAFNRMTEDLQRTTVSRAYVENIIDSMTESLIVVLPEGSIQTVNNATCNLLGYEEKELIGKPFDKILPKRSKDLNVNHLIMKQIVSNAEEKYLSKDGREIPVLFSSMFMSDIDGHIQGIVCVAHDIIEIKKAEGALRESEEKLTGIINSVTDQMIMLDEQRNIVWANEVAERLFGPDLIGKKCYNTHSLIDLHCEPCLLKKCFEDGVSHEQEMQFKGIKGNRMDFWVTTSVAARHEDGRPKMVVEVFHNITERRALQAEAMRTSHLASIGELAAGVSHEIVNPTNSIINLSQIVANESDQESLVYDIAGRIIKEGNRIASIVSSLLSFGRDRKEVKGPVNLQEIVTETLALSRAQLRKDSINLKVDIPQNLPDIIAQPQQIQQVFMNIVNNARYALNEKYPRDQSGKVLEILGEELTFDNSSYVRITFFDRGTGIATDILEKVMEPFFSTKPSGMGSGLGLSICHGIISDHEGRLRIESNEGEYTKLIVDLPAGGKNESTDFDRR